MKLEERIAALELRVLSLEGLKEKDNHFLSDSVKVLEFLNGKTGKKFKSIESNLKYIQARLREGYTTIELTKVVSFKMLDEFFTANNMKFMRPSTLFNSIKFSNYIEEVRLYER